MTFSHPEEHELLAWYAVERSQVGLAACPKGDVHPQHNRLGADAKLEARQEANPAAKARCCQPGDHLSFPLWNVACLYENWVPLVGFPYTFPVQVFSTRSGTNLVFSSERLGQWLRQWLLSTADALYDCSLIFEVFVNKINISRAWVWPKTSKFYCWYL